MNNERFIIFEQIVTNHLWDLICIVDNETNEGLSIVDIEILLNDLYEENKILKEKISGIKSMNQKIIDYSHDINIIL